MSEQHTAENDAPTWDSLRAVSPSVWRKHRPVGAYLPVGQLDGDCACGRGAWPCPDFLAAHARVIPPAETTGSAEQVRPCEGRNSNVCLAEGCHGEACIGGDPS